MIKILIKVLILFSYSFLIAQSTGGGELYPNLHTNYKVLHDWQDMKFGMFIHWGPVSLRGTEIGWSRGREIPIDEYDNLYNEFNPVLFNAEEWVSALKNAGMKYLIITSKHHDGFCLWPSDYTEYDIASTPFKRDILKELSEECKRQGILFGTYHSIADWKHKHYATRYGGDQRPLEESDMNSYIKYLQNQIKELIEKYDTDILWFDGEWEEAWTHEMGMALYKYIRDLKDDILINNRVDKGRSGMQGMTKSSEFAGDFGTPEQEIGAFHPNQSWESCITICRQWAWKPNDQMKSLKECVQTLAQTAGGGGNLLLNVGPMLDGRIEQRQINRLKEIGDWLDINGESIYGTKGGPFKPTKWMSSTNKNNNIFIHLYKWPEKELILPSFNEHIINKISILNNNKSLNYISSENRTIISLPEEPIDFTTIVIKIELDKNADLIQPLEIPKNKFSGLDVSALKLKFPFSSKFQSKGLETLTDNIRGSKNYTDRNWIGFEKNDLEVTLDLGEIKPVNKVGIGCLQNQKDWIFFPKSLKVFVSNDNIEFILIDEQEFETAEKNDEIKILDIYSMLDDVSARYIKLVAENIGTCPDWHLGAGGDAWLFVDELFVK